MVLFNLLFNMKQNYNYIFLLTCLIIGGTACSHKYRTSSSKPIETFFKNEVKPEKFIECFPGAYYRKVNSSKDVWLGVGGTVTLPQLSFDQTRKNTKKPGQFLDNPSVYLGGNMGDQETDFGLAWEVIREKDGKLSKERKAFRPFMRRSEHINGQKPNYAQAPLEDKYYWYPGEKVTMYFQVLEPRKVHFVIEGAGKRFECDYDCEGYIPGELGTFKRVNAIDQVANEGKPVQATKTKVLNSRWDESYYFRKYKNEIVKVPIHEGRFTDMRCPDSHFFEVTSTDEGRKIGAETISINGNGY